MQFFNDELGFGFIINSNTGAEAFVHQSSIIAKNYRTLLKGQVVEYVERIEQGKRGLEARAFYVTGARPPVNYCAAQLSALSNSAKPPADRRHSASRARRSRFARALVINDHSLLVGARPAGLRDSSSFAAEGASPDGETADATESKQSLSSEAAAPPPPPE